MMIDHILSAVRVKNFKVGVDFFKLCHFFFQLHFYNILSVFLSVFQGFFTGAGVVSRECFLCSSIKKQVLIWYNCIMGCSSAAESSGALLVVALLFPPRLQWLLLKSLTVIQQNYSQLSHGLRKCLLLYQKKPIF